MNSNRTTAFNSCVRSEIFGLVRSMCLLAFAGVALTPVVAGPPSSTLSLIDFEGLAEGTPISTQYAADGVTFSIPALPGEFPIIAVEGGTAVAFQGSGNDNPMASGSCGLTDPLIGGQFNVGNHIRIDFDPPVTSVRFFIADIDSGESFTARAYNGAVEVDSDTHAQGQPGTGNAINTAFELQARSITAVVLEVPTLSGFALDYLTFTRPCTGPACGSYIELSQESAPGAGDFDSQVLGTMQAYPTNVSAAAFYSYNVPEGDSWNGSSLTPIVDRSHLLLAETTNGLSLAIVHDRAIPNDPDGGSAEMRFELLNDPDGAVRTVEDDPPSNKVGAGYTGAAGSSIFTTAHRWDTCCTDGVMLSDLSGDWSMLVEFAEIDGNSSTLPIVGLNEWVAYSANGVQIPLALQIGRRVRLRFVGVNDCPADIAPLGPPPGDGQVNVSDLLAVIGAWGPCGDPNNCPADVNGDDVVNVADLLAVIDAWGPCP